MTITRARPSLAFALVSLAMSAICGCDEGSPTCADGKPPVAGDCFTAAGVYLNSVGFLPERIKRATVDGSAASFNVRRDDDSIAFTGSLTPLNSVSIADFSTFSEPGRYYVEVPGVGQSPRFRIATDVYHDALQTAMLGLYGQRCGTSVHFLHDGNSFSHDECHMHDGYLDLMTGEASSKPSLGGWHDAGDYGKYTINGAFSLGLVLKSWEHFKPSLEALSLQIPEHGGALPDFLAEAKWQLDWLLTMQFPDGSVSHKVTATNFEGLEVRPSDDEQKRYFAPVGTAAAATFTAAAAMAARIYAAYDAQFAATCLDAAKLSYAYLIAHPLEIEPDLSKFKTGGYQTHDADDRLWAIAELWETTGDPALLADLEANLKGTSVDLEWDWGRVSNLGLFTYVLSARPGKDPDLVSAVEASVFEVADRIVKNSSEHAFGRGIGDKYYWGINGTVVRTTLNLQVARRLSGDDAYLDAALLQVDHLLGRNLYGRSQVTGIGYNPPFAPHHRPSVADRVSESWPGLVVGGPWPEAESWVDAQNDYKTNEVAINWSAALIYALAGL